MIATSFLLIRSYGSELAGEVLKNLVTTQSNGKYEVDFSEIEILVLEKRISFTDLNLLKSGNNSSDTSEQVYSIKVPQLQLSVGSILDLYFHQELTIEGIKIHDPEIQIAALGKSSNNTSLSYESGTLYNAISTYINVFSVDNLDIRNASIKYSKPTKESLKQFIVDQINFSVANFLVDSSASSNDEKFLYSDKIELVISNQQFNLPDSIHAITFDEFSISTSTGDILFKNINLLPKEGIELKTLPVYYKIQIPELNFRGLDFSKAYYQNELKLDSVRLFNPQIQIKSLSTVANNKSDILSLSTKLFEKFEIDKFYIDNGTIDINFDNNKLYSAKELDLMLAAIDIDSIKISKRNMVEFFEEVDLEASSLQTYLMDSTHLMKVKQFHYSSKLSELAVNELALYPIDINNEESSFSIYLDKIKVDGMMKISDLLKGKISANKLTISNPSLDINILENQKKDVKNLSFEFFEFVKIDAFSLKNGDASFKKFETDLNIKRLDVNLKTVNFKPSDLDNFDFNKFSPRSHFDFRSLTLRSKEMTMDLNQLNLNDWKDLTARDIFIKPKSFSEPLKISAIKVTEFDLDHFLYNQQLAFDTLIVDEPIINVHPENDSGDNKPNLVKWAHHTSFKEMQFKNGQFTKHGDSAVQVHLENFDIELSKFHFDSIKNEYYTLIGYKSDSIYLHLEKLNHSVTGNDLSISIKDSTLHVKRLNVEPIGIDAPKKFSVSTHELRLRQIDFHKLINQQQVHFHSGYLLSPKAKVIVESNERSSRELAKELLIFNSLNISNGQVHIENHIKDSSMIIEIDKINILVNGFNLGQDSTLFSAKNYLGELQNMSFKNFGSSDSISFKKAFINTKVGSIDISSLRLAPSINSELLIPKLEIRGLDPEILAYNNHFVAQSIEIDSFDFKIDLDKNITPKKKTKSHTFPTLSLDQFRIKNGLAIIKTEEWNLGNDININDINLSIDSIKIDSTSTLLSISKSLSNTKFSLSDISIATKDSLYKIGLDSITYHGEINEIELLGIKLDPEFTKSDFQERIKYQQDWLDMKISSIKLKGLDSERLIKDGFIDLNEISIFKINLDTHKDKRLPIPPDNEKLLPQAMISQIEIPFYIDSISLFSSFISHSEFSSTGTLPGLIFFKDMNGTIKNISNDSVKLAENRVMSFNSTGSMMNTGRYNVDAEFDLMDTTQFFYFEGELLDMDLTELNEMLENIAYVHIKDGYNKRVTFNFEANHDYAIGEMKFYYNDLKIMVLKKDDQSHKRHAASIKSFFANTFVVNKKNPHFLFVRQGDIFHHRDVNKAVFNYWAKALLSGVVSSIGAKNNKKEIKKMNAGLKAQMDRKRAETLQRVNALKANN